ncbi:hypothetical protein AAHK20_33010 [Trinickia sp. YCB016]
MESNETRHHQFDFYLRQARRFDVSMGKSGKNAFMSKRGPDADNPRASKRKKRGHLPRFSFVLLRD